jgi:hypothetical protein
VSGHIVSKYGGAIGGLPRKLKPSCLLGDKGPVRDVMVVVGGRIEGTVAALAAPWYASEGHACERLLGTKNFKV